MGGAESIPAVTRQQTGAPGPVASLLLDTQPWSWWDPTWNATIRICFLWWMAERGMELGEEWWTWMEPERINMWRDGDSLGKIKCLCPINVSADQKCNHKWNIYYRLLIVAAPTMERNDWKKLNERLMECSNGGQLNNDEDKKDPFISSSSMYLSIPPSIFRSLSSHRCLIA